MDTFSLFLQTLDPFFIFFFRLSGIPIVGYLAGTAVLAALCVILGQITIFAAFWVNRRMFRGQNTEMVRMQNLSIYALLSKDKTAYSALNREANEAFGKVFFSQVALSASSLWPVPFALAWMQTRFEAVAFALPVNVPVIGDSVGYAFTFIPTFILAYILFGRIKRRLPIFNRIESAIEDVTRDTEEMVSLSDFITPSHR